MQKPKSIWDYAPRELYVENGYGEIVFIAATHSYTDTLLRTAQEWADRLGRTMYIRAVEEGDDFCLPFEPTEEE